MCIYYIFIECITQVYINICDPFTRPLLKTIENSLVNLIHSPKRRFCQNPDNQEDLAHSPEVHYTFSQQLKLSTT